MNNIYCLLISSMLLIGCSNSRLLKSEISKPIHPAPASVVEKSQSIRKAIVFKPTQDLSDLVPVRLSDDKKEILSYPAASDLPDLSMLKLENGYQLDLIGVNITTAYLNISINEYKTTSRNFSLEELKSKILIVNPYLELYECNYDSIKLTIHEEFNQWIKNGTLSQKCKQIKIYHR